ncbi:hypothetical protein F4604DRAFT_2016697 [Suillus subluteus]|nr:hypothetical protein F4604DRAFT_2016697 [Suillus subluteus]
MTLTGSDWRASPHRNSSIFADHLKILTDRQDKLLQQLAGLTKDGFLKVQEEWEKSVVVWERCKKKAKNESEAGAASVSAPSASADAAHPMTPPHSPSLTPTTHSSMPVLHQHALVRQFAALSRQVADELKGGVVGGSILTGSSNNVTIALAHAVRVMSMHRKDHICILPEPFSTTFRQASAAAHRVARAGLSKSQRVEILARDADRHHDTYQQQEAHHSSDVIDFPFIQDKRDIILEYQDKMRSEAIFSSHEQSPLRGSIEALPEHTLPRTYDLELYYRRAILYPKVRQSPNIKLNTIAFHAERGQISMTWKGKALYARRAVVNIRMNDYIPVAT